MRVKLDRKWWALAAVAAVLAGLAWFWLGRAPEQDGLASGNGRLEAVELELSTRIPARLLSLQVQEGEQVRAGQVLARLDCAALQAQRGEARAQLQRARDAEATAHSQVRLRRSERDAAAAQIRQRDAEWQAARSRLERSRQLLDVGGVSRQQFDDDRAGVGSAEGALAAARAQAAAAAAAIEAARLQAVEAGSAVLAASAALARVDVDLGDCSLRAPVDGQVQYVVARPGEMLGVGARVISLLDTSDLGMSFFLPESDAGKVAIGDEARIVPDALAGRAVPALVSYVSAVAQFTPKTVETASERQKLMFRVRARVDARWAAAHRPELKSGMPGVAYVRVRRGIAWPAQLQVRP
ncbi:MAG: HlyD family efflux transporter periplasmic adaptor subunit [Betaproteobacteria bacterium]|nr:HlyD family efflux transporter periplasmic adaptor subunit [Betaproteobacteria bacterium]MBU6511204.1 HlyD family efflux transporter periplasmic adaptor subunit [Betaproteobacteria bacterium]MDE1956652.1 HlyD family efflux transporter periplasmic adaptor subunit [Betaproteobacteria bacterium]MDE2151534.1 HlyD family efflux transporter periplasmic adaptor subunit [Betaproteobacteria bacterium]